MMTRFTPQELAKLPKWAQRKVVNVQRELTEAVEALREHDDSVGATDVHVRDTRAALTGDRGRPLPPNAVVRFTLGDLDEDSERYVDVSIARTGTYASTADAPALLIHGGRSLVMRPQVTNVLLVRPETWAERYGAMMDARKEADDA